MNFLQIFSFSVAESSFIFFSIINNFVVLSIASYANILVASFKYLGKYKELEK